MKIREPILAGSWYPQKPEKIDEFIRINCKNSEKSAEKHAKAAISPHAGWRYSGKISAMSVSSLENTADTVVIIGGHLPENAPFLFAEEDAAGTPYGPMPIDIELRELLINKLNGKSDRYQDNTVEVIIPMVRYFFPEAKLLWARFPQNMSSFEAGKTLAGAGKSLGRNLAVIGSTDLTHYGVNYDFTPKGTGQQALDWVRTVNDASFIRAVLHSDPQEILRCAVRNRSACSAGAVLGVLGFTDYTGCAKSELLEYGTSADVFKNEISDSFVGYASIIWNKS